MKAASKQGDAYHQPSVTINMIFGEINFEKLA
jgi:hypothetical protein